MLVDQAYLDRVRRALFAALMRANTVALAGFGLLTAGMVWLAATNGDWTWAMIPVLLLGVLPFGLWRSAGAMGRRAPLGTYVAFAVTPDGTFHSSGASGTTTVNPGYVYRVSSSGDCWIVTLRSGLTIPVPRELLPEADARRLTS